MADVDLKAISNERRRRNYQKNKRLKEAAAVQEIKKRRISEEWARRTSTRNKSSRYRLRKAKLMARAT